MYKEAGDNMVITKTQFIVPMVVSEAGFGTKADHARYPREREMIPCKATATTAEDNIIVKLEVLSDSEAMYKEKKGNRAALRYGSVLQIETKMPSVLLVDNDVLVAFVENLVSCIRIEHDSRTGVNSLVIE